MPDEKISVAEGIANFQARFAYAHNALSVSPKGLEYGLFPPPDCFRGKKCLKAGHKAARWIEPGGTFQRNSQLPKLWEQDRKDMKKTGCEPVIPAI